MFTPFCINRSRLEGSARGESKLAANYPSLGNAIMVSTTVTTHRANTVLLKNSEPFITSKQRKASLDRAGKLTTLEMDSVRVRLHAEGVFEDSGDLFTNARRSGTIYKS